MSALPACIEEWSGLEDGFFLLDNLSWMLKGHVSICYAWGWMHFVAGWRIIRTGYGSGRNATHMVIISLHLFPAADNTTQGLVIKARSNAEILSVDDSSDDELTYGTS